MNKIKTKKITNIILLIFFVMFYFYLFFLDKRLHLIQKQEFNPYIPYFFVKNIQIIAPFIIGILLYLNFENTIFSNIIAKNSKKILLLTLIIPVEILVFNIVFLSVNSIPYVAEPLDILFFNHAFDCINLVIGFIVSFYIKGKKRK